MTTDLFLCYGIWLAAFLCWGIWLAVFFVFRHLIGCLGVEAFDWLFLHGSFLLDNLCPIMAVKATGTSCLDSNKTTPLPVLFHSICYRFPLAYSCNLFCICSSCPGNKNSGWCIMWIYDLIKFHCLKSGSAASSCGRHGQDKWTVLLPFASILNEGFIV